jgi:alpha-1,3-fucosyltransferase
MKSYVLSPRFTRNSEMHKKKKIILESAVFKTVMPYNITASDVNLNDSLKIILMWNEWNLNIAQEPLSKIQCPKRSCLFTTDISLIKQSDVVVLHFDTLRDFPVNRRPDQRFVFYHFESPENTAALLMDDPRFRFDFFNWTMTYRRDSDIYLRDYYGSFVSKLSMSNNTREMRYDYSSNRTINHFSKTKEFDRNKTMEFSKNNLDFLELISRKTKMVTWFVGNCITKIRREEYVRQLSQYVPVDIFGRCAKDCPMNCDEMIRTNYKFYLAFENSWCPDYITEKFSRPLLYDAIPIVLGGADYNLFAPPHSYINARDFNSPKDLAEYLMELNRSDSLYASYFYWKNEYYISVPDLYGWCELCVMAHDRNLPSKVYHDIKQWWMMGDGKCETNSTKNYW